MNAEQTPGKQSMAVIGHEATQNHHLPLPELPMDDGGAAPEEMSSLRALGRWLDKSEHPAHPAHSGTPQLDAGNCVTNGPVPTLGPVPTGTSSLSAMLAALKTQARPRSTPGLSGPC